jgi:hypothetical protein
VKLETGDFNGDGILDVAAINAMSSTIQVLSGRGDGTFANTRTLQLPRAAGSGSERLRATEIGAADMNADGTLDLVVLGVDPDSLGGWYAVGDTHVSVFLGDGSGNFALRSSAETAPRGGANDLDTGDFDGDGDLDLLIGAGSSLIYSRVYLLRGNGDGTLQPAVELGSGAKSAVADFNGDGRLDFASQGFLSASLRLGNGDGTFQAPASVAVAASPAVADVNADGNPDLVSRQSAGQAGGTVASVLLGNGNGTFQARQVFALPDNPSGGADLSFGDFNGDGSLDVAADNFLLLNADDWDEAALPPTALSISDTTVTEGNTGTTQAVFTVTLSEASTQTVTVAYATTAASAQPGSDYLETSGTVTFAPGETSKTIHVTVLSDTAYEGNESFRVNLSNAVGALVTDGLGWGTIVNDDPLSNLPHLSISDVSKNEGRRGTTNFIFTVTLSAPSTEIVTVGFATADGTAQTADDDYSSARGALTFYPGETSKSITIKVSGDRRREGNDTFFVNLERGTNSLIDDGQGIGTIRNDD